MEGNQIIPPEFLNHPNNYEKGYNGKPEKF